MPVPTSYDEAGLAAYMVGELSDVGVVLGWNASSAQVIDAVTNVEIAMGVSDIASALATDIPKVRALARVAIWQAAKKAAASRVDISEDGQSLKLSQLQPQITANLNEARISLGEFDDYDDGILVGTMTRDPNPYQRVNISGVGEIG